MSKKPKPDIEIGSKPAVKNYEPSEDEGVAFTISFNAFPARVKPKAAPSKPKRLKK